MGQQADNRSYQKPPIVEAVIALTFSEALDQRTVEKVKDRLAKAHPSTLEKRQTTVQMTPTGSSVKEEAAGYRLSDQNEHWVLLLSPTELVTSNLAPYEGWSAFRAYALEIATIVKGITGFRKVARLGVRYINRIDVPGEGVSVNVTDYLTLFPHAPKNDFFTVTDTYYMRMEAILPGGITCVVQTGSAVPPILEHTSFLLDIDVSLNENIPQNERDLWTRIDELRTAKNQVFELAVTDNSRGLFD